MSKIVAIAMVRDEADIISATVTNLACQVDEVIVADNGSTDGTRDILSNLARDLPVTVIDDPDPAYMQSEKMTRLAHLAGERGAGWVIPFDADEVWYSTFEPIPLILSRIGPDMMVATAELYDHVASGSDSDAPDPTERIIHRRREALPLPKVACRWRPDLTIWQGNHGCDYAGVRPASVALLVVRHFPYRSVEQFVRKVRNGAAAYRATGDRLPADAGAHWRQWGEILDGQGEDAVAEIFRKWYWRRDPTRPLDVDGERLAPLVRDPAPVRR